MFTPALCDVLPFSAPSLRRLQGAMNDLHRIRLSLLVMGLGTGATALLSVVLNAGSPGAIAAFGLCGLALLAAHVSAYRERRLTRLSRLVILVAPVLIAMAIGPNALALPLVGVLSIAMADARRPSANAAWFTLVAVVAIAAQPHDEFVADLPVLPGYAFIVFLLAHVATALRRSMDDRDELYRQLVHQARHDELTGLPNRTVLKERLEGVIARGEPYAVMMVDFNGFKDVNDRFGHTVGDRLLQIVAGRLDECVRGGDLVVRFGGDEFVVLVEPCPERAVAAELVARIEAAVRRPADLGDTVVEVSASVGVAFDEPTPERALSVADAAMYAVKATSA
jgi:diguanylate cyclase (GGDEF)-like protein